MLGRGETRNRIGTNGEARLQRCVHERTRNARRAAIFDIGANEGAWLDSFFRNLAGPAGDRYRIHAFEPVPSTLQRLTVRMEALGVESLVSRFPVALSDVRGSFEMVIDSETGGTNSLEFDEAMRKKAIGTIEVKTETLDDFCKEHGVERIEFVKCDAEGHDLRVIRGGMGLLDAGRINVLQFEYNHRWIHGRSFLKDVFEIVAPLEYRVGRVRPHAVEIFDEWHPELERFFEGNYVLLKKGLEEDFGARVCRFDETNAYS